MLFAATDRRLGATLLWCALIVLGWALLSVFFGGSAAHADDRGRDQHPSAKASISQPQAPAAKASKPQAPKSQASPTTITQLQASATSTATTVKQVAPATSIRPAVAAKADRLAVAVKDATASADRKPHPHADGVRGNGRGAHQTDGHRTLPAHANARAHERAASDVPPATRAALKPAHPQTIAQSAAPAHASATTQAAAPATGDEPAVADEHALTSSPSTPPSAGSSMSGAALSAVLLPYDLEPAASGAIGVLSRAADVPLPTGRASSTDVSPD